ncbi:TPA: hypothetical protein U2M43_001070 [Providencia stuartii]|nr:hypothetical protein [Providencia stuartii]
MKIHNEKFIATNDFQKYLEANGWYEKSTISGLAVVWRSNTFTRDEILQPIDTELSDYSNRVDDIIRVLSKTQEKPLEKIISDINTISSDVISIRVIHDDVKNGEIPFHDGIDLFSQAKLLITSAARSLINPKNVKSGGKNNETVSKYFDTLKLSQTEIGSYIINIVAPIYFIDSKQDDHCSEPFSRSVSSRIVDSVDRLNEAASEFSKTNNLKYFEESVSYGVNELLCSSIIGLSGSNKNRSIEISIKTSPYVSDFNVKKTSVTISADKIPAIQEAKNYFSGVTSTEKYKLQGIVIKLYRKKPESNSGTITIEEANEKSSKKPKRITVELPNDFYDQAIKAHEIKGTIVRLTGRLISTSRKSTLCDVTEFTLIEPELL